MLDCQISTSLSDDAIEFHGTITAMRVSTHCFFCQVRSCSGSAHLKPQCNQSVLMAGSLVDLSGCFACPGTGS